jgi:hypothetical protein
MQMKRLLFSCTTLAGAAAIAPSAAASDGIKLEVGGFLYVVYQAVFDQKHAGAFGPTDVSMPSITTEKSTSMARRPSTTA